MIDDNQAIPESIRFSVLHTIVTGHRTSAVSVRERTKSALQDISVSVSQFNYPVGFNGIMRDDSLVMPPAETFSPAKEAFLGELARMRTLREVKARRGKLLGVSPELVALSQEYMDGVETKINKLSELSEKTIDESTKKSISQRTMRFSSVNNKEVLDVAAELGTVDEEAIFDTIIVPARELFKNLQECTTLDAMQLRLEALTKAEGAQYRALKPLGDAYIAEVFDALVATKEPALATKRA